MRRKRSSSQAGKIPSQRKIPLSHQSLYNQFIKQPTRVLWLEFVTMVAIVALVVNRVTGIRICFPESPSPNAIIFYYFSILVFVIIAIILLMVYGEWIATFRRLEHIGEKILDGELEAGRGIIDYTEGEINRYNNQFKRRYFLLVLFLTFMFLADICYLDNVCKYGLSSKLALFFYLLSCLFLPIFIDLAWIKLRFRG